MRLVDTHAHLMDPAFDADRDAVLARARAAGIEALLLVGYDVPSSRAAVDLAREIPWARATVGIHPNSAAGVADADFDAIADLALAPEVVAIGETGLDYYREHTPPSRQRAALEWHLRLAERLGLPTIVHNRQADADVADALSASAVRCDPRHAPGILHCFSSTDRRYLECMLDAGYFVSFAGPLTFNSAADLRAMASRVPLERLLVETDCPYLAPVPHRGRRNEPAFIRDTVSCLADVVDLEVDRLAQRLWANCLHVFPAFERVRQEVA
ncbi:MAG: TatD family hydrolase [Chloroflexi bacterium]|nr:TatD family hydrolase [Chloroflexota bacterium]